MRKSGLQAQQYRAFMRAAVAACPIRLHEDNCTITISIGVAQWHPRENLEALIHRADEALYEAKRNGRDRVALAEFSERVTTLAHSGEGLRARS